MFDLFEYIIVAKSNDYGWVVPVVLVIFYVIAGIARARKKPEDQKILPERKPPTEEERKASEKWGQKALREQLTDQVQQHHRELSVSKEPKEHSFDREIPQKGSQIAPQRKNVMREMMEEVYRQATGMPPRQPAKPVRKVARHEAKPKKPLLAKKPVKTVKPQPKETPRPAERFAKLERMGELQRAIVYSEILGRPVALRPDSNLPGLS